MTMKEQVKLKIGITLEMELIKKYRKGKLFFLQERLCLTDLKNNEIQSNDIIDFIEQII